MEKISNVGIMSNAFRAMAGLDTVYGYDIAVNENISALLKYGKFDELTYFYEPLQYQEAVIRRKYRSLYKKDETNMNLNCVSELDILNGTMKNNIDVLHNVDMEFMPQIYYRETNPTGLFPVTYMIHGASYPYYINNFFLMKLLVPFKTFDSLICTSNTVRSAISNILNSLQDYLKESSGAIFRYEGRLDVLPLGIDTNFFKPMDRRVSREKFNISNDAFVLLWIGRFSAYDKADLLPIFITIKRIIKINENREIKMIVAGHDRQNTPILDVMKDYAKALNINNNIVFLEGHDLSERPYLYSCADVFVSPIDNVQETFGLTPIEAMACGVPQVVSDWDGYKDTVDDGVTGYRIPTYWMKCDNDIVKNPMLPSEPMHRSAVHHLMMAQSVALDLNIFVQRIQSLIDDASLCKKMSENSLKRTRKIYEWEELIPRYESLWAELKTMSHEYQNITNNNAKPLLFTPHYCDYFSDYPTRFVQTDEKIRITEEGNLLLEGELPFPRHYEIERYLGHEKISMAILVMLREKDCLMCNDVISELNEHVEAKVKRAIMLLIKYGFVELY